MKQKHCYCLVLLLVLGMVACRTPKYYVYAPTPPVNPFFKKAGETKLSAYMSGPLSSGTGAYMPGLDAQAAVAVSNHFALTGSYTTRREKDSYDDSNNEDEGFPDIFYNRKTAEVGAGYFTKINDRGTATFNLYGGYGWGTYHFRETAMDGSFIRTHQSDISKWYVQPSIHFMPGDVFRLGLVTRLTFPDYKNIVTSYTTDELKSRDLDKLSTKSFVFFEPTINMQIAFPGAEWMKMDIAFTFCPAVSDDYDRIRTRGANALLGFTFDFSKIGGKKK